MKEIDRLEVIREVLGRRLRQREAGERLGICVRQVKRLVRRYRELGARGLVSGHRGRRAPNAILPEVREEILAVVRERYEDFSPTLAQGEVDGGSRLWGVGGDLAQVDGGGGAVAEREAPFSPGSIRAVPDGRRWGSWCRSTALLTPGSRSGGPYCTLIVFIDDATSRLMALRFAEAETTEAYMRTLRGYLDSYGRPVALYSDKHSIFRVNLKDREGEVDSVHPGAQDPGHPTHPRQHPPGQGPRGTGQPDPSGPPGEGVATSWHRLHRPRQRLPARVPGRP